VFAVRSTGCHGEWRKRPQLASEAGSARNSEGGKPVFAACNLHVIVSETAKVNYGLPKAKVNYGQFIK
jgi:hypothetical protein